MENRIGYEICREHIDRIMVMTQDDADTEEKRGGHKYITQSPIIPEYERQQEWQTRVPREEQVASEGYLT